MSSPPDRPGDEAEWLGRRVTGDTMLGCGTCDYCRRGVHHVCPNRFEIGITDGWPGALAEQLLVPTRFAYPIPENVSVAAAALVEPGGNALRAVRAAQLEPGRSVLILGSGTIGLLAAQFALAEGADVHLAGVRASSLDLARELGIPNVVTVDDVETGDGERFDAVIDCTSVDTMPALAVRLVKPAGRVVYIGLSSTPSLVDSRQVALKDVTVVGILSASPGSRRRDRGIRERRRRARRTRQRGHLARGGAQSARRGSAGRTRCPGPRCTWIRGDDRPRTRRC